MNKRTRNIILAAALLLVLVVGAFLAWQHFKPVGQEGGKTIAVAVIHADGSEKDFSIRTDAEFLRGALEEQKLIEGEMRGDFFMVLVVDGETADYNVDGSFWAMTQDGEWLNTGVDTTPIADGDHYEFTYTPAA